MGLFNQDYELHIDSLKMRVVVTFDDGTETRVEPHLCSSHDEGQNQNHLGIIDVTTVTQHGDWGHIQSVHLSADYAAAIVEALSEVIPWALLNKELNET